MEHILDTIDSPADLKKLSVEQMKVLADEVRELICGVVSANGGHLAPSLGVVELTIALHASLDCPTDKIIWDVGHQSYAHKILTGRRDRFPTLRTENGISGFPRIAESEADAFGTGHAATAISAALGFAAARDLKGTDERVVAVVGDGAISSGLSFEGLNSAGAARRDMLVVLNDNKMSISPNVGALSKYLTDVISTGAYNKLKKDIWNLTGLLPGVAQPVRSILNRMERSVKNLIVPGVWFESLGFRYFGPVDGHDIGRLLQVLSQLKKLKGPLLLHVYTTKGKGYCYAENDATRFHGVTAFELSNGESKVHTTRPGYSAVFGKTILDLAEKDASICAITAAMADSTGLEPFSRAFPDRFFDVGIAEGHAITFAAGLARGGCKPFVAIYSSFLQRSYDNILHDAALQNLPVVICIDRAGFVGEDGPTHHGVFDISFLRHIPGLVLMAPKDENELRDMIKFAADYRKGPVAIRFPRGTGTAPRLRKVFRKIEPFTAETLREGVDGTFLAVGEMVPESLAAAEILAGEGLHVGVVNMRFIHPLDSDTLLGVAALDRPIVTVEENVVAGGFGAAVLEFYASRGIRPDARLVGVPDEFAGHATRARLLERYGLDAESIARVMREAMNP